MKPWKYALRSLVRRPGFSLAVLALLSLGIAANTALFSVVDTVLLRPLPYPDPARLVTVYETSPAKSQALSLVAPGRLEDWSRLNRTFSVISGSYTENVTDTSGSEPERLSGRRVAPRYFQVFGMRPLVGRMFTADEERNGGPGAAVISYGLWTRRYGQDPRITTRRLAIAGHGFSIVGVMPKEFSAPSIDIWLPAQLPASLMQVRNARFYSGVGRLRPGVTLSAAQADLAGVERSLGEQFPATDKGWSATLRDLKDARVGDSREGLLLLFGAVGLLLLITVTNVAGLALAQLNQRQRELAIRGSIGATRAQVVASVMREIALLAAAGALGGWALASLSIDLLAKELVDVPRMAELHVDWRALAFACVASLLAAVAFGWLPALRATSAKFAGTWMRAGRGIAGRRQRLQQGLVAGQVAITMVLLAGAGLLVRSFYNLSHVDLGFQPANTLTFHVGAAWNEDRARIGQMQERLIAGLQRLPRVEAAGMTNFLPAEDATLRYQAELEGVAATEDQGQMPVGERTVSPGYLQALRVPLLSGQWCPELRHDPKTPPTVMVNRRFTEVYAHGTNVVGRQLRFVDNRDFGSAEIVGIVGDMKEDTVNAPAYPYVYACAAGGTWPDPDYVVRTAGDPRALLGSIRQLVRDIDPNRAIFGVQTLDEALAQDLDQPRSNARMLGLFALAALLLASVGLYGLMAQMVNARRQEIGIRMALGAEPGRIVWSMVAAAGRLIAAGIAVGLVLMLAAQPLLRSLLFKVGALDGFSLAGAGGVLAGVAVLAAFVPARRAAAIDAVETLRAE